MKATINKSQLMKRAWDIYRGNNPYSGNFSTSLRRAWEVEKDIIRYAEEQAEKAAERAQMGTARREVGNSPVGMSEGYNMAVAAYYSNATAGTYFGD